MNSEEPSIARNGYCIYVDMLFQGAIPTVSDENGYIVFETELAAQKEIVDNMLTRLREFLDGHRDYEDAITVEEYVVPVLVHTDGTITDSDGNCFSPRPE